MINIQLHNDCPATDTIVPNQFIDRFMPSANGEFVKVYLYLLRCIHSHASNCTISEIADKFNNTEMDIQRALRYWQKEGLLSLEETADGKLCGIGLLPFPEDSTDTEEASSSPAPSAVSLEETPASAAGETFCASQPVNLPQEPQIRHYTLDEIAEFQKNPDIQEMLFVVETYIRHPFSENDINTILFCVSTATVCTCELLMLLKTKSMQRKLPPTGIAGIARFLDSSPIRLLLPPAKIIPTAFIFCHLP